MILLA